MSLKKHRLGKEVWRYVLIGIGALIVVTAVALWALAQGLPSSDDIVNHQVTQSTKLYDRTGKILLYETGGEQKRTVVPFDQIPQDLKNATLAIEDERFYSEPAFDWRSIVRAVIADVLHGSYQQGASTITQQLARNSFLSPQKSIIRKLRELILAIKLNQTYSKDQILGLYLNEIPYGSTFYGVESAAHGYFGKSVGELNLAESAILAALPQAPTYYSPWGAHTDQLFARQKTVLTKMVSLHMITQQQMNDALKTPITFQPQAQGIKAPHFSMMVLDYLTQKYGEDIVDKGGLTVQTTLDWDLQQAAEQAVADGAARNEQLYNGKNASLVAEDPKTGQILALVGSRNYFDTKNDGNFNVATQGLRQPGSALKPFVYLTAFQKGYTPDSLIFDVPTEFTSGDPNCPPVPPPTQVAGCFHPQNFEGTFLGPVSFRNALAQSMNVPAVKVLYLAGMNDVLANANAFGLTTLNDPSRYGLTLVLGGGAVHLIDLTEAYSVLAQEGVKHEQAIVMQVQDQQGNTLESFHDQWKQVVDPQYPRLIDDVLSDTQARAGLFQASLGLTQIPGYQVALKTGTSNDYRDTWAMGYTPFLVAGVWAGNNNNAPLQRNGSSILAAVPIWSAFMNQAVKKYQPESFTPPAPVSASKPMMNGSYSSPSGIHNILYYVNKSDPTGPPPADPAADPQFYNWETALQAWLAQNPLTPDAGANSSSTGPGPVGTGTDNTTSTPAPVTVPPAAPGVTIQSPSNGSFITDAVQITAQLNAAAPITDIKVLFNGTPVQDFSSNYGTSYLLNWSFAPNNPKPQNSLVVQITDQKGATFKDDVILYH